MSDPSESPFERLIREIRRRSLWQVLGIYVAGGWIVVADGCTGPEPVTSREADVTIEADYFVPSRPETVSWGWYPLEREPVLTIQSGQTVRIKTLTHAVTTQSEDPVGYLTAMGVPREDILQDVLDFWASREGRAREGRSGHVITEPIHVEGAEPGDML